jgi:hypothetical protein
VLVPDGVGGDEGSCQEAVDHARSPTGLPGTPRLGGQQEDADRDEADAQQGDDSRPLAEQDDGGGGREQGSRAPREGVDEREVPDGVSSLQEDEVPEVQHAAPEHEDERLGSKIGPLQHHHDDGERRVDEHPEKAEEPHEGSAAVPDALGEKVPGRVKGGRRQYQDQREHGHEITLL